jgi:hypothetical protein
LEEGVQRLRHEGGQRRLVDGKDEELVRIVDPLRMVAVDDCASG